MVCRERGRLPRRCLLRGVSAKGGVYPEGCLPRGVLPGGCTPPHCGQADTCKSITFQQLLLGTVITLRSDSHLVKAFALVEWTLTFRGGKPSHTLECKF